MFIFGKTTSTTFCTSAKSEPKSIHDLVNLEIAVTERTSAIVLPILPNVFEKAFSVFDNVFFIFLLYDLVSKAVLKYTVPAFPLLPNYHLRILILQFDENILSVFSFLHHLILIFVTF